MKPVVAVFLLMAILAGCTTGGQQEAAQDTAYLAPRLRLDLPAPGSMGRSIEAVQMVVAHHAGQSVTFEAHISVTPARVLLVGVDATGQRLMTVTWQGDKINVERSHFLPPDVRPGAMLADLVALYWPEAVVRQSLRAVGAELNVAEKGRSVTQHGKLVLHADYLGGSANPWQGGLHYWNYAWDYDIEVTTLQVTE